MKLYISKRGKLIIGQNVDFANKWEVGYPNKIYKDRERRMCKDW